ncbi:hypothetical protein O7600_05395 [Micromonospora sp. WMMA1998]|uniref:hypothetical protein n=1 Tax=Micromonospora sp. WMMA1998 TaxID=3015167 RepID=UPI00248BB5EF|nr:hypothetical protein [Micromonospora sp. WMMA1998]WBC16275.1 hypothetical protein O7600_05395 [Micromonospora sp. WMMA1998]
MASWDDVRRVALALPETTERGSYDDLPAWRVRDKMFAWERPLRRADLDTLGDAAPDGPILAARVPDLGAKEALLADDRRSTSPCPTSTATRRCWCGSTGSGRPS